MIELRTYEVAISITIDLHIQWVHHEDLSKDEPSKQLLYTDHVTNMYYDEFLMYRNLMLEAGFVPKYAWSKKNNPEIQTNDQAIVDWQKLVFSAKPQGE